MVPEKAPPDLPAMPVEGETPPGGEIPSPPNGVERNRWEYIVVHHSASPSGNAASFDRMHKGKGWDGLAYHFVIDNGRGGPDGRLEVGGRWWKQKHGAHAGGLPYGAPGDRNGFNEFGIGICLVGNLEQRPATPAQMATLARLIQRLRSEFVIADENIVGHRHVRHTACPGRYFSWKSLFTAMELPPPTHLFSRTPTGTPDRCPWCWHQPALAARADMRRRPVANQAESPDLPPSELLKFR